ncbi:hypothetical protein B0H13DRAFT_2300946 [Mycena leptocephala]|nr:hypothetical protein B0H13DRAFT_2300946 [Mycena leptocephala]
MDAFYDDKTAAAAIDSWAAKICTTQGPNTQDTIPAASVDVSTVTCNQTADGKALKAMVPGDGNHRQEAIFTVVGALRKFELPPVRKTDISVGRVKYARQHSVIVGYTNTEFKRSLGVVQEVAYMLSTSLPEGQMGPWTPDMEDDIYGGCFVTNSRYFTVGRNIPAEARVEFGNVAYLEMKKDKLITKDPAGFREGDIVQLGFAVVAYRTHVEDNAPHYTCKLVTRLLTLLDNNVTKAAYTKRNTRVAESKLKSNTNNNKRGKVDDDCSSDEDVEKARQRFNRMRLVDTGNDTDMV